MRVAAVLLALIAASACVTAARAAPVGVPAQAPAGFVPGQAIYCAVSDGSYVPCGTGGSAVPIRSMPPAPPLALTPTIIAAANTYQQAAAAGSAARNGGFVQPATANTGVLCVDTSAGAAAGLTTPTGGQICGAVGQTTPITFPATSGPVFVVGTVKGDAFSGSVN